MTKLSRFLLATLVLSACAGSRGATTAAKAKYPPRPARCALTMFHSPGPAVAAWDDLGVAEVTCHFDVGFGQCLQRFRAEACRMGGDIVYDIPEGPLRPKEQAVLYRGRVAHTRMSPPATAVTTVTTTPQPQSAPTPAAKEHRGENPDAGPDAGPVDAMGAGIMIKG